MTANDIQKLLKKKHAEDVYVPECNSGPVWGGSLRLDGWAMKKSWASPLVTGYEIKVSRADFLNDEKYLDYRRYCDVLYLVAPPGIIEPGEVPEGVGFYQVASTGSRLFKKLKAVRRDEPLPEEFYRYILMSRARIDDYRPITEKEFFVDWLEKKEINKELGHKVSKELSKTIREMVLKVELENDALLKRIAAYEQIEAMVKDLGINPYFLSKENGEDRFKRALSERMNGSQKELSRNITNTIRYLEIMAGQVEGMEATGDDLES